jgi:DNA-damage-inducible protein D
VRTERKGLKKAQRILDWMATDELAANLFRASLTQQKRRNDPTIETTMKANQAHHDVGNAVRNVMIEQGGASPERLPTPEASIQELQRREQRRMAAERQPSLFPDAASDEN